MTLARYARRKRDHLAPHAEMIVGAEREAREVRLWMLSVVVAAEENRRRGGFGERRVCRECGRGFAPGNGCRRCRGCRKKGRG